MYFATVILLLLVFPAAAAGIELAFYPGADKMLLAGKWFTFFAVGVRLFIAGLRQSLQPAFTAQAIFKVQDTAAFPIVREVGFGNLAMGAAGLLTLLLPAWLVPAAFTGGLYYGLAGLGHALHAHRNAKEEIALWSDAAIFVLLMVFVASRFV